MLVKQTLGQIKNSERREAILNFIASLLEADQESIARRFMELLEHTAASETAKAWHNSFYKCLLLHFDENVYNKYIYKTPALGRALLWAAKGILSWYQDKKNPLLQQENAFASFY